MSSRILAVAVDCHDPDALAGFWCRALGYQVIKRWQDARGTGYVQVGDGEGTVLLFQPVGEDKAVKNRLHLDIAPVEGEQYEEVRRLVGLGARRLSDKPDFPWIVLADPEGNEFCVLPPR